MNLSRTDPSGTGFNKLEDGDVAAGLLNTRLSMSGMRTSMNPRRSSMMMRQEASLMNTFDEESLGLTQLHAEDSDADSDHERRR